MAHETGYVAPLETTVRSDSDLYRWIKDGGGIRRDAHYTDSTLSMAETQTAYAYLWRKTGAALDQLAQEIAEGMPWFGIRDADDLYNWLAAYVPGRQTADFADEYRRTMRSAPTLDTGAGLVLEGLVQRVSRTYGRYGARTTMLVLLGDGCRVLATVPRYALRSIKAGQRVRFMADVTRSDRDQTFGFARYPREITTEARAA